MLFLLSLERQLSMSEPVWDQVGRQFATLLKSKVYLYLLDNPEYCAFLARAGLRPPFIEYAAHGIPPESRKAYDVTCDLVAAEFKTLVEGKKALIAARAHYSLQARDLQGHLSLYRVASRKNRVRGEWWFDNELLESLLEDFRKSGLDYRLCLLAKLRNRLAICEDWSFVTEIWEMKLPRGSAVPVISGEGLRQKAISEHHEGGTERGSVYQKYSNQFLEGGAQQYWLPWIPDLHVSDYMVLPTLARASP